MSKRPLRSSGTLIRMDNNWYVQLSDTHPSYADNTPVDLMLWDNRPAGEQNEVEEIARIQQLEPEVVALSLSAEGTLRDTAFAKHFSH